MQKLKRVLLVAILLFVALQPLAASAQELSFSEAFDLTIDCEDGFLDFSCAIMEVIIWVFLVFGRLWAFALQLAVKGTLALITFGVTLISSEPVRIGFKATLGFTNLIFVIAIIIIAFSTILRFEAYSIKKMLPKLIIAALLVNFSLLIAGLFLDAANVFTSYFINGGVDSGGIAQAFNPQKFLAPSASEGGQAKLPSISDGSWGQFAEILLGLSIAIIMTIVMTFIMIWVMITVLIRNLWIVFLVTLMPLIWGFWVIPFFQEHWSNWWKNFIKWTISLPTITFFLWLAVKVATTPAFNESFNNNSNSDLVVEGIKSSLVGVDLFSLTIRMLIVVGLIIGGLKAGKAFSVIGAGAMLAGAGFFAKATMGGIGKTFTAPIAAGGAIVGKVRGTGALAGASKFFGVGKTLKTTGRGIVSGMGKIRRNIVGESTEDLVLQTNAAGDQEWVPKPKTTGNLYGKASNWLSKKAAGLSAVPGMAKMAQVFGKMATAPRAAVEEAMKEVSGLAPEAMKEWIKAAAGRGQVFMAAAAIVAQQNHLNDALHGNEGKYADALASFYPGVERKDIATLVGMEGHDPTHAPAITGRGVGDAVKSATAGDIQSWSKDVFRAVKNLMSPSQIKAWASRDAESHMEALAHAMSELGGVIEHLKDGSEKSAMMADFASLKSGKRDTDLMRRVSGYVETISGDKELLGKLSGELRSDLEFARDIKRVTVRTKSSSGHPPETFGDFSAEALMGRFFRSVKNAAAKAAQVSIPSSGGHGGHGDGGHGSGKH